MKFRPEQHIIGKVYHLTQDNMNAMIRTIENLQARLSSLLSTLEVEHDHLYTGDCAYCQALKNDVELEEQQLAATKKPRRK